jgi:hypothetical protein
MDFIDIYYKSLTTKILGKLKIENYCYGNKVENGNNCICLFFGRTSNFSAIWRLSPLLLTGLQI